jgi:hypothetical protein
MTHYRRNFVPGGSYFFTVNLFDRRKRLLVEHVGARAPHSAMPGCGIRSKSPRRSCYRIISMPSGCFLTATPITLCAGG